MSVESVFQQAIALMREERRAEAAAVLAVLRQAPTAHPSGLNLLGVLLAEQKDFPAAIECLQRAHSARPQWIEPLLNVGNILRKLRRLDESRACFERIVALQPQNAESHRQLGAACGISGDWKHARLHSLEALRLDPKDATAHSNVLMASQYDPHLSAAEALAQHRLWDALHGQGPFYRAEPFAKRDAAHRPLRIGFVSGDLREHAVATFLEPLVAGLDRSEFDVYLYATRAEEDATTLRLKSLSREFRWIHQLDDPSAARLVREDAIDVLVDVSGHSASGRLGVFARRAAPVQATWLGYPGTTGLAEMDYLIADAVLYPEGGPAVTSETVLRLPHFCCWQPPADAPAPLARPADAAFVFGSTHKAAKLNDEVVRTWAGILAAIPDAHLHFSRDLAPSVQQRITTVMSENGVDLKRLRFSTPEIGEGRHLAAYGEIDILLDAFPWSSHTTACEALWMGVPVLTLRGERHAGRTAASVLTRVGLDDWIAASPADYVALAKRGSDRREALETLRRSLRRRVAESPLTDARAFAAEFGRAMQTTVEAARQRRAR